MDRKYFSDYIKILNKELVPALGCTEPIAIAFAAAKAASVLGEKPGRLTAKCSGNIIKNVTTLLNGRGGGSSTFAQGRTPLTDVNICEKVVEEIENE